jgi:Fe-S cluster assembly iron-binding protein IscA
MFQVSEKANEMIKAFLKERNLDGAVRILMAGGG